MNSKTAAARIAVSFTIVLIVATSRLLALDDHNPIGVTGAFEGVTTTGGAYNVLNHNATRQIDDIVVPGAIGKYGLKMSRYYNSRRETGYSLMGPGWTYEYSWSWDSYNGKAEYPNGNVWERKCTDNGPLGVSDWPDQLNGNPTFRLADGGTVVFGAVVVNGTIYHSVATQIIDPYGQPTTITYYANTFQIYRVTEPGGRYLQFNYTQQPPPNGPAMLTRVEAHGLGNATVTDWVNYTYASKPTGGAVVTSAMCLTSVDYSDGQHASYTYTTDNVPEHQYPCPCSIRTLPLVSGCDDVRYHGPMRRIAYLYQDQGPHGAILQEKYWDGVSGHEGNGPMVSRIDPPAPSPLISEVNFDTTYTEYRGDGPTRTFTYTPLHLHRVNEETCPIPSPSPNPAQQFVQSYTDFKVPANSTRLGYDPNWYINSVRDANNYTTSYARGSPPPNGIGEVLSITHPDGSHIDYIYDDHGHYVHSISNERQKVTTYTRDSNHRVTQIDYPADANTLASSEEFLQYNNFGQFTVHQLKNGASESFVYDGRGLLTDKYNPKFNSVPGGSDPHIHYDYYTAADGNLGWIDHVKKMTLPANVNGSVASDTYEYDRALSGGITNLNGAAVAGRGLVTKITHADGTYQRFKYDAYGNKVWADNELRKITQYAYDDYNRLLSVTDPLSKTTQYDYATIQGNITQAQQHTTNSARWVTAPSGIKTNNVYDGNWRKTSTTPAYGTLSPTSFIYDPVGNLTDTTDPRGKITHNVYDNRNRKTEIREAFQTAIEAHTVWHYDAASNINQIDRPDGIHETKGYDALNRMIWHTVPRQVPGSSPTPAPINLTTHIYYNPSGTIEHVTDERNKPTAFQYNASDEKTMMTYPLLAGQQQADTQSWVWDNAHNLASRTTVHGETQSFSYDSLNRKTDMRWSNTVDSAHYTYYADSRLNIASNPNSTVTRRYDDAGHLTLDQQNVTGLGSVKSVNYPPYDDDGRATGVNVTNASYDYTYSYDAAGRFETIKPTGRSAQFEYEYDAASNETHRYAYLPNSTTIDQNYGTRDSLNRMPSRLVKRKGTTFSTEAYAYDHMNRVKEVNGGGSADSFEFYWDGELMSATYGGGPHFAFTEGQDPDLDTTDNIDTNAGYKTPDTEDPEPTPPPDDYSDPPVGGLIPEDLPTGHSVGYYFDKAGNRQQVTDTANPTINYVQNNINQYKSASGCSITNGLEHEVSSFQGLYDTQPVNYNYLNDEHLISVSGSGNSYSMAYDALGRCVKRVGNGTTTYYINDGEKPIVEYASSTSIVGRNVYGKGIDEILMRTDPNANGGNPIYYAQDHEGSVTHLLDGRSSPATQTGNVIEQYHYDAFGAPTFYDANTSQINSTAYNNRFLFTGREYAATYRGNYVSLFRFYEYRARAYHPDLGRFMSEDPKGFDAGDYNRFRYCHNDPVDFTDPMGTQDQNYAGLAPREVSRVLAEITNAERISLWQKSMESSIGGEAASNTLSVLAAVTSAHLHSSVMNGREAAGLRASAMSQGTSGSTVAVFSRQAQQIVVMLPNGDALIYPAANNTLNPCGDPHRLDSNGPAPNGTFPIQRAIPMGDQSYGPYFYPIGSVGQKGERLDIARQRGIGLHAGRDNYLHPTHGCIRMNNRDISDLHNQTQNAPLQAITIGD